MVAERIGGVEANKEGEQLGGCLSIAEGQNLSPLQCTITAGISGVLVYQCLGLVQKWSLTGARVSKCAGDVLCRRDTVQKCWLGGTSHTKESNRCSHDLILASLHALPLHWSIRNRQKIYQSWS